MDLSLLLIHYHTPDLAAECVAALRDSLAEPELTGLAAEIVVVDNGSDQPGHEVLTALPVRLVEPGRNLGYAGGIRLGMERAGGDRVVVLNPDVLVRPGCLARLLSELDPPTGTRGADVVGPRFFLDRERRCRIPPTEPRTRTWELCSVLADRGRPWTRPARRIWRRHARRHWLAAEPLRSFSLSGALLAFHRRTWELAGPFDDRLPLYFEEDDWLQRVRRQGLTARYVPAAEAVHLHGRSSAREPRAAEWFERSRDLFRQRWYGSGLTRLLGWLEPGPGQCPTWPSPASLAPDGRPRLPLGAEASPDARDSAGGWIELSPSPRGFPAAGLPLEGVGERWELPASVWRELAPGTYRLQWVDARGRERIARSFSKPPEQTRQGARS